MALLINYILTELLALIEDIFYSEISMILLKYTDKYIDEARKYKNFELDVNKILLRKKM